MRTALEQWFERKLGAGIAALAGEVNVCYEYTRALGPRSVFGKVSLSISANESFEFESKVKWPDGVDYDDYVLDGIVDALIGLQRKPLLGARFVLAEIGWHPVWSAPIAYYEASKKAVSSVVWNRNEG